MRMLEAVLNTRYSILCTHYSLLKNRTTGRFFLRISEKSCTFAPDWVHDT